MKFSTLITVVLVSWANADGKPPSAKPPKGWQTYVYKNEGFSADFPAKPEKTKEGDPKEGVTHSFAAEQAGTSIAYVVTYDDLSPADVKAAGAKAILQGVAVELKKMTKAKKDVTLNGHPGIELRLEFEQDGIPIVIRHRVLLVKNRMFQVMVSATSKEIEQAKTEHFFKSFKLLAPAEKKEDKSPKPTRFQGGLATLDDTAPANEKSNVKKELKSLEGTWKVVRFELSGEAQPKEKAPKEVVIAGSKLTGMGPQMTLTLNPAKKPKWVDLAFQRGETVFPIKGIYELKGDNLKICFPMAPTDAPFMNKRPASFKTKGKVVALLELKRAKKE